MKNHTGDILISGYYGRGNLGDDAILSAVLAELADVHPKMHPVVVARSGGRGSQLPGVPWLDATDSPSVLDAVRSSSMVLVGGGGLFHDYWPTDPSGLLDEAASDMARQVSLLLLAQGFRIPTVLFAVGVGPLRTEASKSMARLAFRLATRATVRDRYSYERLEEVGLDSQTLDSIQISADPTVRLSLDRPDAVESDHTRTSKRLVLVPRFWDFDVEPETTARHLAQVADSFAEKPEWSVSLVPFQASSGNSYEDDLAVCRMVHGRMAFASKALIVDKPPGWDDAAALISQADLVLAMRYHAVLLAARLGRPVVGLAYDPKIHSLMTDLGIADSCLTTDAWQATAIVERLLSAPGDQAADAVQEKVAGLTAAAGGNAVALEQCVALESAGSSDDITLLSNQIARLATTLAEERIEYRRGLEVVRSELQDTSERLAAARTELAQAKHEAKQLRHRAEAIEREKARVQAEAVELERLLRAGEVKWEQLETNLEASIETLKSEAAAARLAGEVARADLAVLRSTWGVQLLDRYWRWLRVLAPTGSRRRRAYLRFRNWLLHRRSMPNASGNPSQASAGVLEDVKSDRRLTDRRPEKGDLNLQAAFAAFQSYVAEEECKGIFALFAPTPIVLHEGQRPTHLALELSRSGYAVVHVSFRWHTDSSWAQDRLEDGILKVPLDRAAEIWGPLCDSFLDLERTCLVEFPHPTLFGLLAAAEGSGWLTVYDIVDDWEAFHDVGQAPWYDRDFERHLVAASDTVTAVSAGLAEKHAGMRRTAIHLVPNGFSADIVPSEAPAPLPTGTVTLGYFGYMPDAWFNWDLVLAMARARPTWHVHLVGYGDAGGTAPRDLPENIDYLGRQPRARLAPIAANWDVAIVPFREGKVARSADPIKIYEYLGLGLPVVVSGAAAPAGAERWVDHVASTEEFIGAIERASGKTPGERKAMIDYAHANSWKARLDELLAYTTGPSPAVSTKRALFKQVR
jgi:polysaccharide pyruvyl transferase CsaB